MSKPGRSNSTGCKYQNQSLQENSKLSKSMRTYLLSQPGNRKLDEIYAQAYKPRGAFPPCQNCVPPSWRRWPLSQKLPLLNVESWSRGGLGQSLLPQKRQHICNPNPTTQPDFILVDPSHATLTYDPLHDPGLSKHFQKPTVKTVLRKNNFIDTQDFVTCSQRAQNEYRAYLHTTRGRDEAVAAFQLEDAKRLQIRQERKAFQIQGSDWASKWSRWNETLLRGKEVQEEKRAILEYKYNSTLQRQQRAEDEARSGREAVEVIRLNRELERGQEGYGSLRKGAANYLDVNGVTIAKDPVPDVDLLLRMERAEKVKLDKKAKVDAQKKTRWELILAGREVRAQEIRWATEVTALERQRHIVEREARNAEHQRRIPLMREAKRRRLERRQALARKYGMLWLSKVREKLKRQKQDVAHYSSFEIYKSLDYTVGGIYVETGQVKHGAGLLGGVNLKDFMKNVKEQQRKDEANENVENE